jgi:hypothetical protein
LGIQFKRPVPFIRSFEFYFLGRDFDACAVVCAVGTDNAGFGDDESSTFEYDGDGVGG